MELDKYRDLNVDIIAKIDWMTAPKDMAEQISRETANHQVKAMGRRLQFSVATIIKTMIESQVGQPSN